MNATVTPRVRLFVGCTILCTCIGCDQATKSLATSTLKDVPRQSYLADTIRLEYALNPGGFLSLGSEMPAAVRKWVFIGFNTCGMLALGTFLIIKRSTLPIALFVALVFVLAGGIGNQIDRLFQNGLVTDFINIGIGPLRTGVFNVADIAVTFGAISIGIVSLQSQIRPATPRHSDND